MSKRGTAKKKPIQIKKPDAQGSRKCVVTNTSEFARTQNNNERRPGIVTHGDDNRVGSEPSNSQSNTFSKHACREQSSFVRDKQIKPKLLQRLVRRVGCIMKKSNTSNMNINKTSTRNGSSNGSNNNKNVLSMKSENKKLSKEIKSLVLWKSPLKTLKYASLEVFFLIKTNVDRLLHQRILLAAIIGLLSAVLVLIYTPGQHQQVIDVFKSKGFFISYWLGLGILSSVGLGTGLHTFILYLGPHIASVTLAAYECSSLNFPEPPYPNEILCPEDKDIDGQIIPSLWSIMAKVRFEAFLWGAGTALGELPPYFMAKAARLSGNTTEEPENLLELEKLQKRKQKGEKLNLFDKGKLMMEDIVERVGFFGILLCASIPNPLFDLAGITCGHFLVPFWKFFGATLIGKAIVKMHIQKIFVIISFNENLVDKFVDFLAFIPVVGVRLQTPFKAFFEGQKQRLHRNTQKVSSSSPKGGNLLASVFEYFVFAMICYFIISIINTFAQSCCKRMRKQHAGGGGSTPSEAGSAKKVS